MPEFNIINALKQCQTLLSHFGGHSQAAGFTLPTRNLLQFEQNLLEIAVVTLADVDLRPHIDIDAIVTLPELVNNSIFNIIQQLAPFGQGNPVPIFLTLGVSVVECRTMGVNDEHLRMKFKQNGVTWEGVGFGLGSNINEVTTPLDIVYTIEMDRWNGRENLRLNVLDIGETKSGFIKEK